MLWQTTSLSRASSTDRGVSASSSFQSTLSDLAHSSCGYVATWQDHKLPIYVSPMPDTRAWQTDALSISWNILDGYVYDQWLSFPGSSRKCMHPSLEQAVETTTQPDVSQQPIVPQSPRLVAGVQEGQKIHAFPCKMMVVAPGWPGMPWFWDLVSLSIRPPLKFPLWNKLLKQPHNQMFHSNLEFLNLHAWLLESRRNSHIGSPPVWKRELELLREPSLEPYTPQGGSYMANGVNRTR